MTVTVQRSPQVATARGGGRPTSRHHKIARRRAWHIGVAVAVVAGSVAAGVAPGRVRSASAQTSFVPGGTISTIAGGGTYPDVMAGQMQLNGLSHIVVAPSGVMYFSTTYTPTVYKLSADHQTVSLYAGYGASSFSGDGGPATAAALGQPTGLALDGAGNLYIADTSVNRIRKVDVATGIITTVAGNGTRGFAGDGGPATAAEIASPEGVAVAPNGDLYIADSSNQRVRKVDAATGVISTFAGNGTEGFSGDGGPATAAALHEIVGVAVSASGDVFITDNENNRIRKVDVATGIITTVAGNGATQNTGDGGLATAAGLYQPNGDVAFDASGNMIVAAPQKVREVAGDTGVISTLTGGASTGFSGDGGPATAAFISNPSDVAVDASGNVYVADAGNARIREIDHTTGVIDTIVGGGSITPLNGIGDDFSATAAKLNSTQGVAVDAAGNTYIADTGQHRIRKVDATTGVITTIAGTGSPGFSGDGGPATNAEIYSPEGLGIDAAGNLYFADQGPNRVRRVDAATGVITTIAGTGAAGSTGDGGPATQAKLNAPTGLALDAQGDVFIADTAGARIRKVDAVTGVITTVAGTGGVGFTGDGGPATQATLNSPRGIAVDSAGDVFIADSLNNRIRRVDAPTGVITTVAGTGAQGATGDGGAATAAKLFAPWDVAVDPAGDVYIADASNNKVRLVDAATGVITTVAGTGTQGFAGDGGAATDAKLSRPYAVATDTDGNLFVADTFNNRVREVTSSNPAGSPKITGTVTDAQTGLPLANICVSLWNGPAQLRTVCTDASGTFEMDDLAYGTYTLSYFDTLGMHVTTWLDGATTQAASTPITIASPGALHATQALQPVPGSISGTVHFPAGDPSTDACVYLYTYVEPQGRDQFAGRGTCTNANGQYILQNIPAGDYTVVAVDSMGLAPTIQTPKLTMGSGSAISGEDLTFGAAPGALSGVITDSGGHPLANICLYAYHWIGGAWGSNTGATCTAQSGAFVLDTMSTPTQDMQIGVYDPAGVHPTMWLDDTGSGFVLRARPTADTALRTPAAGSFVGTIALVNAGSISGTVTRAGTPIQGACVYAYFADDSRYSGVAAMTNASGAYSLTGLAPSNPGFGAGYKVLFVSACDSGEPTNHWNDGAATYAAAPAITLDEGVPVTGIDADF